VFGSCNEGKQEITLNVIGEALPPLESLGSLSSEYEEKTGVKIKIHPFEFETALQKTQLDFASGNGEYDIVMGIFYNHGKYAKNNYIIPFSRLEGVPYLDAIKVSENNFYPALQKTVMEYNGETVGYPFSAQTMFLWYRKDLFSNEEERINFFERYGYELPLPDEENLLNWTQYKDLAEFFTRKVGVKLAGKNLSQDFYGTTLQLKRHPCSLYEFTNFVYSFGGQFFDESGDPVINSNANIEALEYYLSLRQFCPPGVTQFTWDDALAQMQQGKIAMTIMWSDAPSSLDNPRESKVVGKVGYSLVPIKEGVNKKVSVFGGWAFMINNDTKYPEEAYKFIQWACSPKFQLKWAKSGGLPASKNIFEDPEYLAIPYMKAQNEALKNLVAWPREPGAEEFISDGILALSKAASDEESATESLNNLQSLQERK
jgi:multiple sugar transport system substrate-binding protein